NAFPHENRLLWELAAAGDYQEALRVYRWYTPLLHLDAHPKLVQYIKLAMAECGYGTEIVRAPRLPIAGAERHEILATIRKAIATRPGRSDSATPRTAQQADGAAAGFGVMSEGGAFRRE